MIHGVNWPQLEIVLRSWVWVQTSGDFLTATSPTVYLFMQISRGKFRLVTLRNSSLVFMFRTSGCKKINSSQSELKLNRGVQDPLWFGGFRNIPRLLNPPCSYRCISCGEIFATTFVLENYTYMCLVRYIWRSEKFRRNYNVTNTTCYQYGDLFPDVMYARFICTVCTRRIRWSCEGLTSIPQWIHWIKLKHLLLRLCTTCRYQI